MQALLARGTRPTVHSSGLRGLTSPSSLARQTVFRPARRKLTFKDAFAILLAPVLTAAFVVDVTSKERRKLAWEKKIAEVQEEIEVLRKREIQTWSALQLRSLHVGIISQKRGYSTSTQPFVPFIHDTETRETSNVEDFGRGEAKSNENGLQEEEDWDESLQDLDYVPRELGNNASNQTSSSTSLTTLEQLNRVDALEWRRYESLIGSKLALDMLLYLRTGKSVLYRRSSEIPPDLSVYPDSIDTIALQLHTVHQSLRFIPRMPGTVPETLLKEENRKELQRRIFDLTNATKKGDIRLHDLVYGYANAIAEFKNAPTIETYRLMVETFSSYGNDTLTFTVMGAIKRSRQIIENNVLWSMIYQYGHFRDGCKLQDFLLQLAQYDGPMTPRTKWSHVVVNNMRVVVPTNHNPGLLLILVRAGLSCDQPHHAEAWATLLLQSRPEFKRIAYLYHNLIRYYTQTANWTYGYPWMIETIKWLAVTAHRVTGQAVHTILRLLEFCVACDQEDMYELIIEAALDANICLPEINENMPDNISERLKRIRQDWQDRMDSREARYEDTPEANGTGTGESSPQETDEPQANAKQIPFFQGLLSEKFPALSKYVGITCKDTVLNLLKSEKDVVTSSPVVAPFQPVMRMRVHALPEEKNQIQSNEGGNQSEPKNTITPKQKQEVTSDETTEPNIRLVRSQEGDCCKTMLAQKEELRILREEQILHGELHAKYQNLEEAYTTLITKNDALNESNKLLIAQHTALAETNKALEARHNALQESNRLLISKLRDVHIITPEERAVTSSPSSSQLPSSIQIPVNNNNNDTNNVNSYKVEEQERLQQQPLHWKTQLSKLRQERSNDLIGQQQQQQWWWG